MRSIDDRNFCYVFELPEKFPKGFCFGGGLPTTMQMVDWFYPYPPDGIADSMTWDQLKEILIPFIRGKRYYKGDRLYLVVTDFGESLIVGDWENITIQKLVGG